MGKVSLLFLTKASSVKGTLSGSVITYPGIFANTDVRYQMQGDAVKEDLILQKYSNLNTFSFELKLNGVTPVVEKDGTIPFSDSKGNKQWFLAKPYMTDAKGKYSEKVTLTLRQESGKTFVDVIADQSFLQDPATQYPVTIDPTIDNWDVQRDNFVASAFPTSIYSSNTYMDTDYNSYFGSTRSLVKFYLSSLPSDSNITSANFNAYQTITDATNASIDAYRVTSGWTSPTWNTQPTINSTPESTTTSNTSNAYWQ